MPKRRERTQALRTERALKSKQTEKEKPLSGQRAKRSDRHVEGVSFDTTLAKKSPEVKELTAEMPAAEAEFPIHRDGEVTFASAETEVSDVTEQVPDPEPVRKKKNKMDADAIAAEAGVVAAAATAQMQKPVKAYRYPPLSLLKRRPRSGGESDASLRETAMKLQQTLQNFGVHVTVTNVSCGPSVT